MTQNYDFLTSISQHSPQAAKGCVDRHLAKAHLALVASNWPAIFP